ncbi:hypothetical protein M8818_007545 [Zalaria obscura]|uniref:Uncharacterized protein n=1 Tax=Zalaria obscura TaxID=2024903 RepID=A0ACC3S6E6_9PEZI
MMDMIEERVEEGGKASTRGWRQSYAIASPASELLPSNRYPAECGLTLSKRQPYLGSCQGLETCSRTVELRPVQPGLGACDAAGESRQGHFHKPTSGQHLKSRERR